VHYLVRAGGSSVKYACASTAGFQRIFATCANAAVESCRLSDLMERFFCTAAKLAGDESCPQPTFLLNLRAGFGRANCRAN